MQRMTHLSPNTSNFINTAWAAASPLLVVASFVACLCLVVAAWLWGPLLWRAWARQRIRSRPFPAAWRAVLRQRWPAFAQLPADVQLQLKKHAQVLLSEKPFIGCAGLQITDEMRVLVATQAALLLLHRPAHCFAGLREVLLYPGSFAVQRNTVDASGIAHTSRQVLAGESQQGAGHPGQQKGRVVLSWADVLAGAAQPHDGHNVVIHEFAHQLDQETGQANGAPWLGAHPARYAQWSAVLGAEFAALRQRLQAAAFAPERLAAYAAEPEILGAYAAEPEILGAYAAQDEAEFFAVASEVFFERPHALARRHPHLFTELARYYRSDPRLWWPVELGAVLTSPLMAR
jgi:MtfA peptidase